MKSEGEEGISDKDAEVLRAIEEEGLSTFTFDGLRRIIGAHPETLSRALDRLEEDGIVVRSPDGYSTTGKARDSLQIHPANGARRVPLLHTFLPLGSSNMAIVSALKGRWFDRLRWVGMTESEEGTVMKWVTEDTSAIIDARISGGQLDVEARIRSEADLGSAVRAAHHLVGRISRLYSGPRHTGRSMLMQVGYFRPYAM